jgi:hypothetical protein
MPTLPAPFSGNDPPSGSRVPQSKIQNPKSKILVLLLVLLLGCGGAAGVLVWALTPRTVAVAGGATDLLVRMDETPPFDWNLPPLGHRIHPGPQWSLYGDGTVVLVREGRWYSGTLGVAARQDLLRRVVDDAAFFDTDDRYVLLPNTGSATFTVQAGGRTHTTQVEGLATARAVPVLDAVLNSHSTGPQRLRQVAAWLTATVPLNLRPYRPAQARLYLEATGAQAAMMSTPWPFDSIELRPPPDAPTTRGPRVVDLHGPVAAQALAFAPTVRYVQQERWYAYVIVLPILP